MIFFLFYAISFLSSKALDNVKLSIYSISAPMGTPLANLVIFIPVFSNTFFMYKDVISPSTFGLKAKIISL